MSDAIELKVEDIKAEAESSIKCPVRKALYYISGFLSGPMCGKCFPCSMGSYEAKVRLQRIVDGHGTEADVAALKKISAEMLEASMCKKGKDTARFISAWIDSGVFTEHVAGSRCRDMECISLFEYVIRPGKCTLCGLCKEVCNYNAIMGEKTKPFQSGYLPYEIRQRRCVKCGECIKVCPEGAIVIVGVEESEPVGV